MSGKLTTHVLDTVNGCPAAGMTIELWQISQMPMDSLSQKLLKQVVTNNDGRTDSPVLAVDEFAIGIYELRFAVGDYFTKTMPDLPTPLFLNWVPIQFGLADTSSHYHVPLLCSPWSYSTYRGS